MEGLRGFSGSGFSILRYGVLLGFQVEVFRL